MEVKIKCSGEEKDSKSSRSDDKVTDIKDVWHSLNKIVSRNVRFTKAVFLSILKAF